MRPRPLPDQPPRCGGPNLPREHSPREIEDGILTRMFRVKVWWGVIIEEHTNDDSKE
jgi:hypothetical protein